MKRFICLFLFAFGLHVASSAQTDAQQEEEVEGVGNILGYFGKKLGKELGTRLNLESEETEQIEMVPTKVKVKFGPFTMERTEYRPKVVAKAKE